MFINLCDCISFFVDESYIAVSQCMAEFAFFAQLDQLCVGMHSQNYIKLFNYHARPELSSPSSKV